MSMIDVYLNGTPWAVPVTVTAFVLLVAFRHPLARRVGTPWVWLVLFGTTVAGFLGVIATPNDWVPDLFGTRSGSRVVRGGIELPPNLWSLSHQGTLNTWLAVPMSTLAGWALVRHARRWPVVVAAAAPFVAEGTQWLFPSFGRVAFVVGDVTCNLTGVVLGLALGTAAAGLARATVRSPGSTRGVGPPPSG